MIGNLREVLFLVDVFFSCIKGYEIFFVLEYNIIFFVICDVWGRSINLEFKNWINNI